MDHSELVDLLFIDDDDFRGQAMQKAMELHPGYRKSWLQFMPSSGARPVAEVVDSFDGGYLGTSSIDEAVKFINSFRGNLLVLSDSVLGGREQPRLTEALKQAINSGRGRRIPVFVMCFSTDINLAIDRAAVMDPKGIHADSMVVDWEDLESVAELFSCGLSRLGHVRTSLDSLLDRIFPDEAKTFFRQPPVPHIWSAVGAPGEARKAYNDQLQWYLRGLLKREPPVSWFDSPQSHGLHDALKGLVGACSLAHASDGRDGVRNLSLGSLALLLAAAVGPDNTGWLDRLILPTKLREVFPGQTHDEARKAVLDLADSDGLFGLVKILDDGSGRAGVVDVELTPRKLRILLGFPWDQSLTQVLERDQSEAVGGQFVTRLRSIQSRLAPVGGDAQQLCELKIFASPEHEKMTMLEFIAI